jgi:hypothetical protein
LLNATNSRIESLSTGRTDHNKVLSLAMTRQFKARLKGAIEVRRVDGSTDLNGSAYRENAVVVSLSMQL